ncbi:MAG TPA: peptidylprolyl isomerase [Leeuwenhoekiella sp.]|nr:peptidylprolyl isomerase [Leeuwenhoekiella sp.]HAX15586.1 peptidylprolyl isomerase [Leeuwenhoekiella sp.]HBO29120.1 peptidylprolyl isomerase [Leeuwenhoekiella sp.]HCQ77882.1 peptidylprolyl isomerase [Leeuwenhoekiella sp.]|tara:strand:+ start:3564 stop:4415 length:852 start_codon:yes stop_codon:yes gene_type:complete
MRFSILVLFAGLVVSCDLLGSKVPAGVPVARVGNAYLYKEDIEKLITAEMSPEDSTTLVNGYINRWATKRLLVDNAQRNITLDEQDRLNNLVEQYKLDLFSQAYKDALVARSLDSSITDAEASQFYTENKENFKLNESLLKLRYIEMGENDYNEDEIKKRFTRFNAKDKRFLDSISVQFRAQYLNDSTWISLDKVIAKIPPVNVENSDQLLNKTEFLQLRDSLGLYLIAVNDRLDRNDDAPLEYVLPTVKQILLNRRKLDLIKQLEKDITKDAIKNKQFELYN